MSRRCHHGARRHLHSGIRERSAGSADGVLTPLASEDAAPQVDHESPLEPVPGIDAGAPAPRPALLAAPPANLRLAPPDRTGETGEVLRVATHTVPSTARPDRPIAPRPPRPVGPSFGGRARTEGEHAPATDPLRTLEPIGLGGDDVRPACTAPQLRRFIKSRAYVPMHELRRRFAIGNEDDEVTPVDLQSKRVFVGLPGREGRLLGELFRAGDIGYELSLDPITPIVVGVYAMRPVARG